jgi:myo-inositol-1(or 4)-monophosphatase
MPSADLAYVIDTARRAGALVRDGFGCMDRQLKTSAGEAIAGFDQVEAVTDADRAAQRLIVSALRSRFPDDGIIGEESDGSPGITAIAPRRGRRSWVIDPIDGTNNYVAGLGCYAVCIGLIAEGMPTLGVVYDCARDLVYAGETPVAGASGTAWSGSRTVRAVTTRLSDRSLIMLTCNLFDRRGQLPGFIGDWLAHASWKLRMLGSAALEAAQVGVGVAHAAITVNGKLWDLAAPGAIILAAGGRITDFQGKDIFPYATEGYSGSKIPFLASGAAATEQLLEALRTHGWPTESN